MPAPLVTVCWSCASEGAAPTLEIGGSGSTGSAGVGASAVRLVGVTGGGVDGAGGEDGGFEQGVGGDAVCAVRAGGGDLTSGEEAGDGGAAVQVGPDAAHVIVRGGRDGDRAGGEVVAALEAALVDAGEAGAEEIGRLV